MEWMNPTDLQFQFWWALRVARYKYWMVSFLLIQQIAAVFVAVSTMILKCFFYGSFKLQSHENEITLFDYIYLFSFCIWVCIEPSQALLELISDKKRYKQAIPNTINPNVYMSWNELISCLCSELSLCFKNRQKFCCTVEVQKK